MADFSVTYTATRSLTAGHADGSIQTLDIDLRRLVPTTKINATQTLTPNDAESEYVDSVEEYDVQTRAMDEATMLLVHEFLHSVSASEPFTVSLKEAASRDAHLILNRSLRPEPFGQIKYRYSFKIRVY